MFEITAKDTRTRARTGKLHTKHGVIETPAYVIVGTNAEVRTLTSKDLVATHTQIIIANTYHLWRALKDEGVKKYQGLHLAMSWERPLMTDSGGFQVFSLGAMRDEGIGKVAGSARFEGGVRPSSVVISEDGVAFQDGEEQCFLDAEKSIAIQEKLGADLIVAFDECTSPLHSYEYTKEAMERTHRWAQRSIDAKKSDQLLMGVVQGGIFEDLRRESARVIGSMEFGGFAIGGAFGSSYGGTKEETFRELEWTVPLLPDNKHRHLLGIGRVDDIFLGVKRGIDTFDCVIPTREARHGSLWTRRERIDLHKGKYHDDQSVLDKECMCSVCYDMKLSKGALREMFKAKNMDAGRFATIHNVFFFNDLMMKIRSAIKEGRLDELQKSYGVSGA